MKPKTIYGKYKVKYEGKTIEAIWYGSVNANGEYNMKQCNPNSGIVWVHPDNIVKRVKNNG